ncbi:MAG: hypothetical protein WCV86_03460 [Patescibacteria group bacterium]|jgi:hypothetical protein
MLTSSSSVRNIRIISTVSWLGSSILSLYLIISGYLEEAKHGDYLFIVFGLVFFGFIFLLSLSLGSKSLSHLKRGNSVMQPDNGPSAASLVVGILIFLYLVSLTFPFIPNPFV